MKKLLQTEKGFTLVEMLLVMLVITVLLLIMIPNVTKNSGLIGDKGCEALTGMVEAQMQAYRLDKGHEPATIQALNNNEYLGSKFDDEDNKLYCPNGSHLTIVAGEVIVNENE